MSKIKPAQASFASRKVLTICARTFLRFRYLQRKFQILGEISDYSAWLTKSFPSQHISIVANRELLWRRMQLLMDPNRHYCVYEFGVAWGYTTNYWLLNKDVLISKWHGFDRFTGLPRAWRDVTAGEFDAKGKTPQIPDERLLWHVGDVENTFKTELILEDVDSPRIIFFDLDLYEPTLFAFNSLLPHLKTGDILYFDEAYDQDERRVLVENVLPNIRCSIIGSTYMALALLVN
jgi:hypothetical protein